MSGEYDEERDRRQEAPASWWRIAAKTIIGPLLVATLPVAGYSVVTWRDSLRTLDLNFTGVVGDIQHVQEWQADHSHLHQSFDQRYSDAKADDAVMRYKIADFHVELGRLREAVKESARARDP